MSSSSISREEVEAMDRGEMVDLVLDLSSRLDELEERVESGFEAAGNGRAEIWTALNDGLEDVESEIRAGDDRQAHERSKLTRRVANLEEELGLEDQDVVALAEGGHEALRESDLARLLEAGPEAVTKRPSPVYHRAETLARNWMRWGESQEENGIVYERSLATERDGLLTRLEDRRNEDLTWKQVHRAMEKIAQLGPENIFLTERNGKKVLVQRLDGGVER